MKAKELAHWSDGFNLPSSPWIKSDWETVLNILSKLLYQKLAEKLAKSRENKDEDDFKEESLDLTFQEILSYAECNLGIPQFVVVCDTKQTIAENQLAIFTTLCALKYGVSGSNAKAFRDVNFPFRVCFDMEVDDSSRYCAGCNKQAYFVERSIIDGKVWHRKCMKCFICKKQLYKGAFHGVSTRYECVTHFTNQILYGDSMYQCDEKTLGQNLEKSTPPPRPPPPKINREAHEIDEETISQKMKAAISSTISPVATPRTTLKKLAASSKSSPEASEKNWEMLNYPEALNPFGSDEEDNGDLDFDETTKNSSNNPFSDDSESENDENDLEEVENPIDRVHSSFDNPIYPSSMDERSLPDNSANMKVVTETTPTLEKINNYDIESSEKENNEKSIHIKSQPPPPPKPPRISPERKQSMDTQKSPESLCGEKKYIVPLAAMVFGKKIENINYGTTLTTLNVQLRKVHCEITQIETTGKRLEAQIIRALNNDRLEWKKSKLVEEYINTIERKCEALQIESILVRKYMDLFMELTSKELEIQMKTLDSEKEIHESPFQASKADLTELLVQLMHMKNDLLGVEVVSTPSSICKSVKKMDHSSLLKKGVKQTIKSIKKKL